MALFPMNRIPRYFLGELIYTRDSGIGGCGIDYKREGVGPVRCSSKSAQAP